MRIGVTHTLTLEVVKSYVLSRFTVDLGLVGKRCTCQTCRVPQLRPADSCGLRPQEPARRQERLSVAVKPAAGRLHGLPRDTQEFPSRAARPGRETGHLVRGTLATLKIYQRRGHGVPGLLYAAALPIAERLPLVGDLGFPAGA